MNFTPVYRIASVVSGSIFYILDHVFFFFHFGKDFFDNFKILDIFRQTSNEISFADLTAVKYEINRATVILYIKPVTDIFSVAVNRYFLSFQDIGDRKRDEFFRKLKRSKVI